MKRLLSALLLISSFLLSSYNHTMAQMQNTQQGQDIVIGKTITLSSKVLNEDRNIMISLPAGYQLTTDKYPVFFILDAETHFNYAATTVHFLSQTGVIPQMIVVGIPNVNRNRDYTPTKVENIKVSGGADNFLKFLSDELQPYIDKNYRTYSYRILAGHSLCGMFSFYTMFNRPELFNSFIGISPWVIYDNGFMISHANSKFADTKSIKKSFYFTTGSLENDLIPKMNEFVDLLKNKAPRDLDWKFKLMEGDDHSTLLLSTIFDGLKYIYRDWTLPTESADKGVDGVVKHYSDLSSKYGYEVVVPEFTLNNAGYLMLFRQRYQDAIAMFQKNIEMHPGSANVYDSMGEAYERSGQMALAKENYEKAYNTAKKANHPLLNTFKANFERASKAVAN